MSSGYNQREIKMKVSSNVKLTNSQKLALEQYQTELEYSQSKIISISPASNSNKLCMYIESECGFGYTLYMGKRGGIYED